MTSRSVTSFRPVGRVRASVFVICVRTIETFFGDEKSRGFGLHESHIADPKRLARLMTAACLAYLWVVYLGLVAKRDDWQRVIHRRYRCDLSLFQLGLVLLQHLLNRERSLPSGFVPSDPDLLVAIGG